MLVERTLNGEGKAFSKGDLQKRANIPFIGGILPGAILLGQPLEVGLLDGGGLVVWESNCGGGEGGVDTRGFCT